MKKKELEEDFTIQKRKSSINNQYSDKVKRIHDNLGPEAPILEKDGYKYRDLNKNGKLDIYKDIREPIEARVEDLLIQMTLEEKVGQMFSPHLSLGNFFHLIFTRIFILQDISYSIEI